MTFVFGVLGLALLDAVLSSPAAANRAGGLATLASNLVGYIVDPTLPAIPSRSSSTSKSSGGSTSNAPTVNPNYGYTAPPATGGVGAEGPAGPGN